MHLLLGTPVATEGRALILDLRTLATRWEAVERLPDCPACNHPGSDGVTSAGLDTRLAKALSHPLRQRLLMAYTGPRRQPEPGGRASWTSRSAT